MYQSQSEYLKRCTTLVNGTQAAEHEVRKIITTRTILQTVHESTAQLFFVPCIKKLFHPLF